MIKHIVFWRLKESAGGRPREENALLIKEAIEGMEGRIPGMTHIEAGIDLNRSEQASDIVLYSHFESKEALEAYRDHPEHRRFKDLISDLRYEKRVVDYEA